MTNSNGLFERAAVFGDIHWGTKSNSVIHNEDCSNFIDWFIDEAHARDCDTGIFMGDWHHNRNTVNTLTMNYSINALRKLEAAFEQFFFIKGNHDLYYRDRRDISSVEFAGLLEKIILIDKPQVFENVAFVPWLVGEEWKGIANLKAKYIFGHFELPYFKMNAMVEMPDTGKIQYTHFKKADYVFSGHFHKRQSKGNVHYIGNPFGHNYSDAGDFDRGAMFLQWNGDPEYVNWEDGPRYVVLKISDILEDADKVMIPNSYTRIILDVDISYEEANFIKSTFVEQYGLRELVLMQKRNEDDFDPQVAKAHLESVDSIVIHNLKSIDSGKFLPEKLIELYQKL